MTFGRDFAFLGNQYHLEIYGVEHFPDLLFFNRELNSLVVIDFSKSENSKMPTLGNYSVISKFLTIKSRSPMRIRL